MAAAPVRKLPMLATALEAYRFLLCHPVWFLKAATVPVLLSLLIDWQIYDLLWKIAPEDSPKIGMEQSIRSMRFGAIFVSILYLVLRLIPESLFSVSWHRVFLLEPVTNQPRILVFWRLRHWKFLGYAVLFDIFLTSVRP